MLDHLGRMAAGPLVEGLTAKDLLPNMIEEAEEPTKLSQRTKGTCVATSATIALARENPAEYARLVADMAAPGGKTTLGNGAVLKRHPDWANDKDGHRTPSMRLLQPALMDYGNYLFRYDNAADAHRLPFDGLDRLSLGGGLTGISSDRLLEALTGKRYDNIQLVTRFNREAAWRKVEAALVAERPVSAGLHWNEGGHQVLAERIADGQVYYTNPWGREERMRVEEFKAHLICAQVPVS